MSLEQALAENTAVMKQLIVVLSTAAEGGAVTAAPAKSRKSKAAAEEVAAAPVVQAQVQTAATFALNPGDPEGTKYFIIESKNTAYRQLPGDVDCTVPDALQVSGSEFDAYKAELAKKFPSASAPAPAPAQAAPAPTAAPATSEPSATAQVAGASGATFEQVVDKLKALHAAQQNAGVMKVLAKYGVTGVPLLRGKASNEALIADIDAALMGLL